MNKTEQITVDFVCAKKEQGFLLRVDGRDPIIASCSFSIENPHFRFNKSPDEDGGWVWPSSEGEEQRDLFPRIWIPGNVFDQVTDFESLRSASQRLHISARMWYCNRNTFADSLMAANGIVFHTGSDN